MSYICCTCVMHESHRCRNEKTCPEGLHYEEYTGSTVRQCLRATVESFQDGYIHCPILDCVGCEKCMEDFGDGTDFYYEESQNYERKPRWKKENGMKDCGLPKGYEDQCGLNRSGMCTLDTADFSEIDRAVGMRGCGFIGVNDRYLMWKHGVSYKDFICGNCGFYEAGEYSHGICACEQVKPHTKGVKVNGGTEYIDSKEYYSGAYACKKFTKKGSEELAKQDKTTVLNRLNADIVVEKSCANCYWNMFKKNPSCLGGGSKIYGEDISDVEMNICDFYLDTNANNTKIEAFKENWQRSHKTCANCNFFIEKLAYENGCSLVHYECNNQAQEYYGKHVTKYTIGCKTDNEDAKAEIYNYCDNDINTPETVRDLTKNVTEAMDAEQTYIYRGLV